MWAESQNFRYNLLTQKRNFDPFGMRDRIMRGNAETLFEDAPSSDEGGGSAPAAETSRYATGIAPAQTLHAMVREHLIQSLVEIGDDQVQPASLDLRLGATAYRVQASFLPGAGEKVADKIQQYAMHEIDLSEGALFEKNCVYIVPLLESVAFPRRVSGAANPKSSTGRLDIFVRLITDGTGDRAPAFDRVREGYKGPLYAEISPRAFSVVLREGTRLNQLRIRRGSPPATDAAMRRLDAAVGLTDKDAGLARIDGGIPFTVDLEGNGAGGIIGWRAKDHAGVVDLAKIGHYDPADFWEPIAARPGRGIVLNPGDFYILASKERVRVPPDHAAEMVPYDTSVGEFRVHYAGFFDPGFGWHDDGTPGTRAVLEVRSHEVPFVLEDGQLMGRLVYERLTEVPEKLYGQGIGSNYARQELTLAKQFRRDA